MPPTPDASTPEPVDRQTAAQALRDAAFTIDGTDLGNGAPDRTIVHCFLGFTGADWDLVEALDLVEESTEIVWTDDLLGRDLAVRGGDGMWRRFECPSPAREARP